MKRVFNLTKDELYDLFVNKKMTLDQIASSQNCSKSTVFNHIKKYEINKEDKINSYNLDELQRSVIIGSLLGDGNISKSKPESKNFGLSIRHTEDQKAYLESKFDILKDLCKSKELKSSDHNKRINGENSQMMYYFRTRELPIFNRYAEMDNKQLLELLDFNSFFIWLLDDGSVWDESYTLSCSRFSDEESNLALDKISRMFNVEAKIKWRSKVNNVRGGIRFAKDDSRKIINKLSCSDIYDIAVKTMSYKLI